MTMTEQKNEKLSEEQFHAQLREERRKARRAAVAFARVCEDGRADQLENAALWLDECLDAWRIAFMAIARLKQVTPEVQDAFLTAWIEHKHIPLSVGHRPVCAAALRVLLPRNYSGPPLMLYRGTRHSERTRRLYGFSWTTDVAIARHFAANWEHPELKPPMRGVVLQTLAPDAVLLMRKPEDFYDEGEVIVDPFRLHRIRTVSLAPSEMTIANMMEDRAALTAQMDAVPTDLVRQDGCRRRSTQDYL
jgi:hypothetical protein